MPLHVTVTKPLGQAMSETEVIQAFTDGFGGRFDGARLLVLIPDHTRTLPLPMLFRTFVETMRNAAKIDFMVALGTHPPLDEAALNRLVGVTAEARATAYRHIGLLNHDWANPDAFVKVGMLTKAHIQQIAGDLWHPSLGDDTPVRINRLVQDYDTIVILGPTFPHEVVGFSGGAKYLFPGISGPEMINTTHWLGALATVRDTIGVKDTPVRAMIHAAASFVQTPVVLAGMVIVDGHIAGMAVGDPIAAWGAVADLSSERHIHWLDEPVERVLSVAPPMYDELWTAAKAMYKLDPAVVDGGEIIVYAPHLGVVSHVHGGHIDEAGYHVRDFYLKQWDVYGHLPLGVLAHGTHLRGSGRYENGVEYPRIDVTLASKIGRERCQRLSLGYMDPDLIDTDDWAGREGEGVLYVPKAGETLYRVRS